MKCRLPELNVIYLENQEKGTHSRIPNPMLFSNIPLLWDILNLVVQDWKREKTLLQGNIDSSNEGDRLYHTLTAFSAIQPSFLKCLFSYVTFFIALDGAYYQFYKELNALNREPFFRVSHSSPPKPTDYIKKVRMIRNISIAHIGSEKYGYANSSAATSWQPLTLGHRTNTPCDLDSITFGAFRHIFRDKNGGIIEQSDDLEIKGILELDLHCRSHLNEYDLVCSDYLKSILNKLPLKMNGKTYYEFEGTKTDQSQE